MDSLISNGLQEWSVLLSDEAPKVYFSAKINTGKASVNMCASSLHGSRTVSMQKCSSSFVSAAVGSNSEYRNSSFRSKWAGLVSTSADQNETLGLSDVYKSIEILYEWERERKGRLASAYAVYFVESNFSKRNLSAVNELLLKASVERLTEWSMVAILRSSYSARDVLPGWQLFLSAVKNQLKHNDRLERLLVGLGGEKR